MEKALEVIIIVLMIASSSRMGYLWGIIEMDKAIVEVVRELGGVKQIMPIGTICFMIETKMRGKSANAKKNHKEKDSEDQWKEHK